jgi:hypothetical protein
MFGCMKGGLCTVLCTVLRYLSPITIASPLSWARPLSNAVRCRKKKLFIHGSVPFTPKSGHSTPPPPSDVREK